MNFESIISEDSGRAVPQFWKAVDILLNNPHTINRRILACQRILIAQLKRNEEVYSYVKEIQSLSIKNDVCKDINILIKILKINEYCNIIDSVNLENCSENILLYVNELLPRNSQLFCSTLEFTFIDRKENYILCLQKSNCKDLNVLNNKDKLSLGTHIIYKIHYEKEGIISMCIQKIDDINSHKNIIWLKEKLFPRLIMWIKNEPVKNSFIINSLSLVSHEKYAKLYNELKIKYGTTMVKTWPENTDPSKFVYEDISIATYLILLWENERNENGTKKFQSFLDLGCGNGLLVHILSSEGYPGLGIDLRKRKIWDHFPKTTRLEVQTIVPSASSLFPEVDWLIGNHSDELTPWIPVIAARSSYNCRFFLLPCCAYEFDGKKYQRQSASKSQYSEYISYVKNISEICGFDTQIDKLRIPSTKRICLIGCKRNYSKEDTLSQDKRIQELINIKSSSLEGVIETDNNEHLSNSWSDNFKPRNPIEQVRNCTQLNKTLISDIIKIVSSQLLCTYHPINLQEKSNKIWNAGGQIDLKDIVKLIPSEMLKQLRNECGGIQTLLKNNGHIFSVIQGRVQFRIPGITPINVKKKRKTNATHPVKVKPCWFHENHPDGCPNIAVKCNFKH
ncbi:probable tRNA (uracil-O(2)-)-methyltransferase [Vespula pensylvanica]|uniref:tRNA (uracil-O(2)-)-methyltransferase n=1 Tax=Vespula pensylvanica TaxID=30213 RepID=A0A834P4D4_VESPE|nr:probable tRNA (uracil-O(2)-)-methyltransferase [Vespula pensylvanica]KAF7427091.1 hypothetical protein H0235_006785 [Vespula pensylvanica]